ncbi:MAG TPA: Lar family restriction alleviation protein [Patescibacteria group bacterium]|nr:Lar family restriction alleviation protein [Patescibacteria group bacterium]
MKQVITKKKQEEFLPCPFCGVYPYIESVGQGYYELIVKHFRDCYLHCMNYETLSMSKKSRLIEKWNTRTK